MTIDPRLETLKRRLADTYPDRRPLLAYRTPFELMVAVALSAQTTDAAVNKVTPILFQRWPDAEALAAADQGELEEVIHSLGFFRSKARNLIGAAQMLQDDHNGQVPQSMEDLTALPGIGRKSANVLRSHLWDLPAVIVDTHFGRVCRRLGYTQAKTPERVEQDMQKHLPESWWSEMSMTVNFHGRHFCYARKPRCQDCPLADLCPRIGVNES